MNKKHTLSTLSLLAALIYVGSIAFGHHNESWLTASGHFVAMNQEEASAFEARLATWLNENEFERTANPGGHTAWAGGNSKGEAHHWYKGTYEGSPEFRLRVDVVQYQEPNPDIRAFQFYNAWSVRGTRKQNAMVEVTAGEFTKDFIAWVDEAPTTSTEPEQNPLSDS